MPDGGMGVSRIAASFHGDAAATRLMRLGESGHLRLRSLSGAGCEAVLVNTAGGIVCGDRVAIEVCVEGAGAAVTIATASAEKCYRSSGAEAVIATRLKVGDGARLDWLPQETIMFDGAALRRSLTLDVAPTAAFLGVETLVFGRLARGETMAAGSLRDSWRVRRGGALVFADDTSIVTPVAATLDRPAVGAGARAVSLLLATGYDVEHRLDPLRAAIALFAEGDSAVEAGVSLRNGLLVARMLSRSPERLRACLGAALGVVRPQPPRSWT